MKTTIELDDQLGHQIEELARREHRTLSEVFREAAMELLARRRAGSPGGLVKLPTCGDPNHPLTMEELQRAIEQTEFEDDMRRLGLKADAVD